MGGSGGLGRVCSWWPAARSAGGADPFRSPAGGALLRPPPHPPGPCPGRGLTDCQLSASGGYQSVFDGAVAWSPCPDSSYPAVQVTDSGGVLAVFQPGTGTGITSGGPGAAGTVDLAAAAAGASVTLNGGAPSSLGSVPWDGGTGRFSGVTTFVGSVAGSAGWVAGLAAGYDVRGQRPGNALDLTVSMPAPRRCSPRPHREVPIRTSSATSPSGRSASRGDRTRSGSSPAGPARGENL